MLRDLDDDLNNLLVFKEWQSSFRGAYITLPRSQS